MLDLTSTIAAIATGHAPAPRAIIRLSGDATPAALASLIDTPPVSPGIHHTRLRLPSLDEPGTDLRLPCALIIFAAGRSYTAEHAAEIQVPGQPALARRALDALLAHPGLRPAQPGEFTARAFLNSRLPLDRAEAVQALIAAKSRRELDAATRLMSGTTGHLYRQIADELATLLALVEAGIDFTDQEDVVPIAPPTLADRLDALITNIDTLVGPTRPRETEQHQVIAVLAGPPNAGKSTLFNALLGRERALVSPIAGTTRDAVAEPLPIDPHTANPSALAVTLIDLAGLDNHHAHATNPDTLAQQRARERIETADIVLHCDPLGRFDPIDLPPTRAALIKVRTKADRLEPHPPSRHSNPTEVIPVCALDAWNLSTLRRAIERTALDVSRQGSPDAAASLLPRHARSLERARDAIARARHAADPSARALDRPELVAHSIRHALDDIGSLIGAITPDDVIGRIFASFCIGK